MRGVFLHLIMLSVALKMLFRDTGKYFGIILGVGLASMVIVWQGSIFVGLMTRPSLLDTEGKHLLCPG